MKLHLNKFWQSKCFVTGALFVLLGSGPLLLVIVLASLGLTKDPNPKPVGFGILAFLTFWPGIILMLVGLLKSVRRQP